MKIITLALGLLLLPVIFACSVKVDSRPTEATITNQLNASCKKALIESSFRELYRCEIEGTTCFIYDGDQKGGIWCK